MTEIDNFTFVVLTYNHSNYILEHLESIKYLIENFGNNIDVDIIIADDASRDDTFSLIELWLKRNAFLFKRITSLSDGTNRGTCKNLTRALEYLSTDYCKITAGDDVYSFENLFIEAKQIDGNHILSGLPLNLVNGTILSTRFDLFNFFATNIIYKKSPYMTRLKRISFFNSPSIIYTVSALLDQAVISFVDKFSVTEDWPLQIKMAETHKPLKYIQIDKIFVYYRRTTNSAYLVKNSHYNQDKSDIFNYLIESEASFLGRLLLRNRLFCYNLDNRYIKRVFNISFHLYGFNILRHIFSILVKANKFEPQLAKHQSHYDYIFTKANMTDKFI